MTETVATPKKKKNLSKVIEGNVLTVTEGTTGEKRIYDFSALPSAIQALMGPWGMSSKVGDSAAGKKGKDALDAMDKTWEALLAGNWTNRAPAAEKVTKSGILAKVESMENEKEKKLAMELLKKLGITM